MKYVIIIWYCTRVLIILQSYQHLKFYIGADKYLFSYEYTAIATDLKSFIGTIKIKKRDRKQPDIFERYVIGRVFFYVKNRSEMGTLRQNDSLTR